MMNIYDCTKDKLEEIFLQNGFKKYNATQVLDWVYKKKITNFKDMTNISKKLIDFCDANFVIKDLPILKKETSKLANKYLLQLDDNNKIECVLMFHDYGNSLCISSQVGCNMGCKFCESGRLKKVRNLHTYELISQVITIQNAEDIRIDYVVVMGIGEPFDNFGNIIDFIKIATNPYMLELGGRHITISTCGLVPKIIEFANLSLQVNLAISLHAPNDEIRNRIMPINKAYSIEKIIGALDYYIQKTNRRVTIEYIMIDNVNDMESCAKELAQLFKNKLVYINLIPYNETSNFEYKRSNDFKINKFYDILKSNNVNVTIRKEMGGNLSAACGQLRAEERGE